MTIKTRSHLKCCVDVKQDECRRAVNKKMGAQVAGWRTGVSMLHVCMIFFFSNVKCFMM